MDGVGSGFPHKAEYEIEEGTAGDSPYMAAFLLQWGYQFEALVLVTEIGATSELADGPGTQAR